MNDSTRSLEDRFPASPQAVRDLFRLLDRDDPWDHDPDELAAARLEAIRQRFAEHRETIPALELRAKDMGVREVVSRADVVPLLFAHSSYKSYPASLLTSGRWEMLLRWLRTVSAVDFEGVDVSGVRDVDEWIDAIERASYHIVASSGTKSKISFLVETRQDFDNCAYLQARVFGWPGKPIPFANDRVYVNLGTRQGHSHAGRERYFARPGEVYGYEKIRFVELSRTASLRRKLTEGTATPQEVAELEELSRSQSKEMGESTRRIAQAVLAHRNEPQIIAALWTSAWSVMRINSDLGETGGGFHPDTVVQLGGGAKGADLPADYRERVLDWFAPARAYFVYGMVEVSAVSRRCEDGRYHPPPWLELLVLDETAENLLPLDEDQSVTGRVAYFDPVFDGRWGGVVTGDRATVHYGRCGCGRPGPSIEDSVMRYSEITGEEDDKISCAAAIESYVRGLIAE